MPELERGDRAVARTGQDGERDQRAVAALNIGSRGHGSDDMPYLLQGRNPRWAARLGNARILGRKIEVFGIRVGYPGLVARLSGEPDKEAL
jgi:hypothetical protein